MRIKFFILIVLAVFLLILGSLYLVNRNPIEVPEKVAIRYYTAVIQQDPDQIYDLLSAEDQKIISREKLQSIFFFSKNPLIKSLGREIASRMDCSEISRKYNDGKLILYFQFKLPDLKDKTQELLKVVFSGKDDKTIKADLSRILNQILFQKNFPFYTVEKRITLKKENGKWKIFLGWGELVP